MEEGKSMSGQQGLGIIHEMIGRARGNVKSSTFHILLWGWIVVAGSLGHFILLKFSNIAHPEWVWTIVLVGIIGSVIRGVNRRKQKGVSTYGETIIRMIWITFLVNYFILVVFIAKINFYITPIVLLLAAGSVFLSGTILKYNPIRWGAVFIWLMAIIAFLVPLPYQLLATAAAMLLGYLIPGYMLKRSGD